MNIIYFDTMRAWFYACLLPVIASSALTARAQVPMSSGYYLSTYGSDGALIKHKGGCFASAVFRSNQCINGVSPVNAFAVEYQGRLYCHKDLAPVIDRPLRGASRNSSVESICSMRGWVHSRQ